MDSTLKLYAYDPNFIKVLESYLRTNYPEAEIRRGKRDDRLIMKRSSRERLTIRFVGHPQQKTTCLNFSYMRWRILGIHYGFMGIWPTLVALSDSNGFIESLASGLGRYLGTRYWTKAECIKPTGIKPDSFFFAGLLLLGCLLFVFCRCWDSASMYDVWWFSGWCKSHVWTTLLYTFAAWLTFFMIWIRKRQFSWSAYVLLPACCMAGWLSLSLGWNINRLTGAMSWMVILSATAVLILVAMGFMLYRLSGRQQVSPHEVIILFKP